MKSVRHCEGGTTVAISNRDRFTEFAMTGTTKIEKITKC